jgi:hypothetical protein
LVTKLVTSQGGGNLAHYWLRAFVWLTVPREVAGQVDEVEGYFVVLGITADSELACRAIAEGHVDDGRVDWARSELHSVDPTLLEGEIRATMKDATSPGVWYSSGRVLV